MLIRTKQSKNGFSLIELLVVIAIISVLAGVIIVVVMPARDKSRDVRRRSDLSQIGRFLYASTCYLPDAGAGGYDIAQLVTELAAKYPQYAQYASVIPDDPKSGSPTQTNYRYQVTSDSHCVIYANLDNENEPITLPALTAPTPNAGIGVLRANTPGPNGTNIFYQISK